jgi:tRNA pseudouridine38-40 synthase
VWWVKEPLDIRRMQAAANLLIGRHDFAAFRATDPSKPSESTVVVVDAAEVAPDEHLIVFRIQASHFLWKMVRRLTGVLVKIGKGEMQVKDFRRLLQGKPDQRYDIAAWTAPASGLFLEGIRYL